MQEPQKIDRSTWMHLVGAVGFSIFVVLYFSQLLSPNGFQNWSAGAFWGFSLFNFLFVIPAAAWLLNLAFTREPFVVVGPEFIELYSYRSPRQKPLRIEAVDLLNVDTNWVKGGGDQHSDLIFFLAEEAYERLHSLKLWRRRDPQIRAVFWNFTNAQLNPAQAVQLIKEQLQLPLEAPEDPYEPA
ncbi:hypothetical protein [Gimesia panareensis]|uniref:hypothetical protein n=1 Tax=Gimesia panareensis TaxID=2527978 RepID=UPI00118C934B|nr:hypothetical protein [Gimesia panareensis]QDU52017.1 hypothetical protein Pan110_43870 [Gimesia panareensis]